MIELEKGQFQKVRQLTDSQTCCPVYQDAVLEEVQKGRVFVDALHPEEAVLVWHYCGFGYVSGKPDKAFLEKAANLILKPQGKGLSRCALIINHPEWEDYFSSVEGIIRRERFHFQLNKEKYVHWYKKLPEGFSLKEIDASILSRLSGRIIPSFSWDSDKAFLEGGKGFAVMAGEEVAAVAFSSAISSHKVDIGIETNEKYRGKGLAKCVASKMAEFVFSRGDAPLWECDSENKGSYKVAQSIGFEIDKKYPIFIA